MKKNYNNEKEHHHHDYQDGEHRHHEEEHRHHEEEHHHHEEEHHHHHHHDHHHHDHDGCSCHGDICGCGHNHEEEASKKDIIILCVAFIIWLSGIILEHALRVDMTYLIITYIVAYLLSGYKVILNAMKNISNGKIFDENFLMLIASLGAFFIGEYPESSAVMLFYNLGEMIQASAVSKSKKSISDLMDIRSDSAVVIRDEKEVEVDPNDVKKGETIVVRAGEKIAIDGVVLKGKSDLDTVALTGEAAPRLVEEGDNVLAGSVNISGVLYIKTTKMATDSTVAKILKLTSLATTKKAKSEKFITKFAKYYTPIVVFLSILIFLVPSIIIGFDVYKTYLYRALTFLVTSCPCALVISVPLSFFAGIGGASRIGVLVKGANYLDILSKVDTVIFDKTGTLTMGSFEVKEVYAKDISNDEFNDFILAIESYSNHPIAVALNKGLKMLKKLNVEDVKEIAGRGISGRINQKNVIVGNQSFMIDNGIEFEPCKAYGTVIYMAIDNQYKGYVLLGDTIKRETKEAIADLKKLGIKKLAMLTGDEEKPASDLAKEIGLDEFKANLLPDEKLQYVQNLKTSGSRGVVFVGDGLNDAPVLTVADVGIAMGGIGTDAAIEAADMVLMTDNVKGVARVIKKSIKLKKIVKQNIFIILFVKLLVLILAALGIVGMWAAIFADVGVAVVAVLNSVRAFK